MDTPMSKFLEAISRDHVPNPPATLEEIRIFEQRMGWRLDPDLRAFYLYCNGARLFKTPTDCPYWFLPLSKIIRARVAMFGEQNDDDAHGPASVYAFCDVQDGNYVLLDVDHPQNGHYPLIDGDHEAWPDPHYCEQLAGSFSEFLEKVLHSQGRQFWLQPAPER